MTSIEYTKCQKELLLTAYEQNESSSIKFRFIGVEDGIFYIGAESFNIENGFATVKISSLCEGNYTPVLKIGENSFVCDKIQVKAGIVTPKICSTERILKLTEKIIAAEEKNKNLEEKISELFAAVYGKSIL